MSRCIVAISGDLGSGKSTVARLVATELDLKSYSTGQMQRELAAELGITTLELNKRAEIDPAIDEWIDSSTARRAAEEDRVLFDSRLAWHVVPDSFKVFLLVDPRVGAERIYAAGRGSVEQYASVSEAMTRVQERRASENRRFAEIYGVRPERLENYDLVVDTTWAEPEDIARRIVQSITAREKGDTPEVWICPRSPFPTIYSGLMDKDGFQRLVRELEGTADRTPEVATPVGLLRAGRYCYICDRHHIVSAYLVMRRRFMPATIDLTDDNEMAEGPSATRCAEASYDISMIHDWERAHVFRYPSYPDHLLAPRK